MRHRKAGIKLNRTPSHRDAMFRNMVTSLIKHERIRTTTAKANELKRWADRLITLAKRGDLHARRQALSIVREKAVVHKLFEEAPKRFGAVAGGYTRVVKLGRRPGDAAPISLVELVTPEVAKPKKKASKKKAAPAKKKAAPAAKKAEAAAPEETSTEAAPEETTSPEAGAEETPEAAKAAEAPEAQASAEDADTEPEPAGETDDSAKEGKTSES